MFNFGILSSQLPILLLIAANVAYFVTYFFNKQNAEDKKIEIVEHNHHLKYEVNNSKDDAAIHYNEVFFSEEILEDTFDKSPVFTTKGNKFILFDIKPGKPICFYSVFSRPPPLSC